MAYSMLSGILIIIGIAIFATIISLYFVITGEETSDVTYKFKLSIMLGFALALLVIAEMTGYQTLQETKLIETKTAILNR